jgi:UDP-N-acetylmuramyl pentapeptide phosphotransferase/UDP-N-acetylglucosamine-1-phosphate transferase
LSWLWAFSAPLLLAAAAISFGLLVLLRPVLAKYALARPNSRSSHKQPTPQGGGIAVIAAVLVVAGGAFAIVPSEASLIQLVGVFGATILLALVGVTDDAFPLDPLPRLVLQAAAVIAVLATLPTELRVMPMSPWWIERLLLFVAGLWFINLVNFMDGIDWMSVAEVIPISAALAILGLMGALSMEATIVALALCGAMIGFAPLNKPVAQVFLGDVGSLPIGLLLGWLLLSLAGNGHLAAALLLPLYYVADTTITLLGRLVRGDPITQAHRAHFYQRAMDNRFSVYQIVGRVFGVNFALAILAAATLASRSAVVHLSLLLTGGVIVGLLLWNFERWSGNPFSRRS